ncbi:uncharacterized protein [Ptychodera flava]|uniref:uncharacterized protein n=1 Tax=Ptychodera flava TaxID=63121 RepID=UPI00396A8AB1
MKMEEQLFGSIRQSPEYFVWCDPYPVKLVKNDEDNLGVKVRTMQGRLNPEESYTLITQVRETCSEQRREKLNAGYRIVAGNGVDITRMNQEEVLKALTSYRDGAMDLHVSYPLRLKDNIVDDAAPNDAHERGTSIKFFDGRNSLDNQVSKMIKAKSEHCKSSESEHSVSLKSMSDSEQPKSEQITESAVVSVQRKGSGDASESLGHHVKRDRHRQPFSGIYKLTESSDPGDREVSGRVSRRHGKQFANSTSSPSHSSQSLPTMPTYQNSPTRSAALHRPPMQKTVSNPEELYDITLEEPHLIVWDDPSKGIEIDRDADGKLGFRYKEVQNKENPWEVFTLVKEVFPNSPALGSLQKGDRILSVNGQHLQDTRKGINTASIVHRSQGETVRIIIQRPKGLRERKPLNPTDIKIDLPPDQRSSLPGRSEQLAESHPSARMPHSRTSKQHHNTGTGNTVEAKKRPLSGSSISQGTGTSQLFTSRPVPMFDAPEQPRERNIHRPTSLQFDSQYHITQVPSNGMATSQYHSLAQPESVDNPVLVSMEGEEVDITITSGNAVANSVRGKKACSVKVKITSSPQPSPIHTPTKDGGVVTPITVSTPTPSQGNGCTCLALWNSPLKDTIRRTIDRKAKCEGGNNGHSMLQSEDVNRNNLNSVNQGDLLYNDGPMPCISKNTHQNGNQRCMHAVNGHGVAPANNSYEMQPIPVGLETHIRNIPYPLFLIICNHMNVKMTIGTRDWRGLADEMGKTMQDIHVYGYKEDPCKALLTDWGVNPNATLNHLIEILLRPQLDRQDVVEDIKNYIAHHRT